MACLGSPTRTRVVPVPGWSNSVAKMSHWTGSVSWNSSINTTLKRLRRLSSAPAAPGPGPYSASLNWVSTSLKLRVPFRNRRSDTACTERSTNWRRTCWAGVAPGCPLAGTRSRSGRPSASVVASRRSSRLGRSPTGTPSIDALTRMSAHASSMSPVESTSSRASRSVPADTPRAPSTWAAKPWMVVTVAASNSVMARCSRSSRAGDRWSARCASSSSSVDSSHRLVR